MNILVAGGSGFIGHRLCDALLKKHHQITVVSRSPDKKQFNDKIKFISWDDVNLDLLQSFDVVINLAGANIGEGRWTKKRKALILNSRINTTQKIAALCAKLSKKAPRLLNASAIGIYGLQENAHDFPTPFTEDTEIDFDTHPDFLSHVGREWEKATWIARDAGCSVVNMRFAVVMDRNDGVFKKLAMPFYFGFGGPLGTGLQPFCWVSIVDVIRAIEFFIEYPDITGPVNIVSLNCIPQYKAAQIIGKILHRPSITPTPAFVLKLMLGQMADELLLQGQHVKPKRLIDLGFTFEHEDLIDALQ